jgi:hypothetical protein
MRAAPHVHGSSDDAQRVSRTGDVSAAPAESPKRGPFRWLWACMLALHLAPLWKVGGSLVAGEGSLAAFLGLLATQALFAAKFADVRWLRLPSRRAALLTFVLATAGAHPEVVFEELGHAVKPAAAVVLAAAPAAARAKPGRWLATWLDAFTRRSALWRDRVGVLVRATGVPRAARAVTSAVRFGRAPPVPSAV